MDVSDEDGGSNTNSGTPAIKIAPVRVKGMYLPDAIASYTSGGKTYLVTANEGDAREWGNEDLDTFYLNEDERDFGDEGVTSPTGCPSRS